MSSELESKIASTLGRLENMGEMSDADAVGTVGNADCGDMLRVWIKFKEENGRKVIDRASFQSFGCETAIAAAHLAMALIKGKSPAEALALQGEEFAAELGPLPPTRIHCTQLVEGALRSALSEGQVAPAGATAPARAEPDPPMPGLSDALARNETGTGGVKVVFLKPGETAS
ncbi:MAG: iron-sulfur cluster assembly scaffold protein [Verrucomicrobia bacterium]|nr:iron-sulfur cluster assembly scaffold protein [Verrucomicrobiota bacterium]